MEERVHTNGSRNGSDTTAGRDTTGNQSTPSRTVGTMINPKTWCTEHQKSMMDCFYEHHQPARFEMTTDQIVLPCGHLANRPTRVVTVVVCACSRQWKLSLEASGHAWDAQEMPHGKG